MNKLVLAAAACLLSSVAVAGPSGVVFNANKAAYAAGPSGPASADFTISTPQNNLVATTTVGVDDLDFNWLVIPVDVPISDDAGKIDAVSICYRTNGRAFISQTRITEQLLPGSATVIHDDGTDLVSATGTCYTSALAVPRAPGGVINVRLKVVMPSPNDSIEVTGGLLKLVPR